MNVSNWKTLVRTRFAPSPTGKLHIGGVRTALFNYLLAKKNDGKFVLRFEDTDSERSQESFLTQQNNCLQWLGINPDESIFVGGDFGPYRQQERLQTYQKILNFLLEKQLAYRCFCSKEELETEKKDFLTRETKKNYKYSRKCLSLSDHQIADKLNFNNHYLIRFFIKEDKVYRFKDLIRGDIQFESSDLEDFVLSRSNGVPLLNFVVTVDDHLMKVTHVLRAEEHLSNTAKQLALYEALAWQPPLFAHLSVIVNQDRKKISKRDKENQHHSVEALRRLGYLPQAIINYLLFLGWNPVDNQEIFSIEQMIESFTLERLNARSPVFTIEKLNWFNNIWISRISKIEYSTISWNFLKKSYNLKKTSALQKKVSRISLLFREQLEYFQQLKELSKYFFVVPQHKIKYQEELHLLIEQFIAEIRQLKIWSSLRIKEVINQRLKVFSKEQKRWFLPAVRKLLTGEQKGPSLDKIILILGKREVKKRINFNLSK